MNLLPDCSFCVPEVSQVAVGASAPVGLHPQYHVEIWDIQQTGIVSFIFMCTCQLQVLTIVWKQFFAIGEGNFPKSSTIRVQFGQFGVQARNGNFQHAVIGAIFEISHLFF
jgi:hypothetical protein